METTTKSLSDLLQRRLASVDPQVTRCLGHASEIIVFGSVSAGLARPDSDIDVLCIADRGYKLKSQLLDLIVEPSNVTASQSWLNGELASHVAKYGTWLKGAPDWKTHVHIGQTAADAKARRVCAFMRALENSWSRLEECFRVKYSLKLRRETQRLVLLERGVAIPPTRVLDEAWPSVGGTSADVCGRLIKFVPKAHAKFVENFLGRIHSQMQTAY